jgi:hypothetical protein
VLTKAQRLENLKSGSTTLDSINEEEEIKVRVYGADNAVAISRVTIKGPYSGKESSGQYRSSHTWARTTSGWQLVCNQLTRLSVGSELIPNNNLEFDSIVERRHDIQAGARRSAPGRQSRRMRQNFRRADFQRETDDPYDVFRITLTHNRSPFHVQPLHAAIVVDDAELD